MLLLLVEKSYCTVSYFFGIEKYRYLKMLTLLRQIARQIYRLIDCERHHVQLLLCVRNIRSCAVQQNFFRQMLTHEPPEHPISPTAPPHLLQQQTGSATKEVCTRPSLFCRPAAKPEDFPPSDLQVCAVNAAVPPHVPVPWTVICQNDRATRPPAFVLQQGCKQAKIKHQLLRTNLTVFALDERGKKTTTKKRSNYQLQTLDILSRTIQ